MGNVMVLAEVVDGTVTKPALELLTLARRIGTPQAVVFGSADQAAGRLGEYGAANLWIVDDPALENYLVAPKAEALAQLVQRSGPAAVLITSSAEGKEVAGRLAVKLGSGLITDATDIAPDGSTTQSVFAGNWSVTAGVTTGIPVITVKPNAVTPEPAPTQASVERIAVAIPESAKGARIVRREPRSASGRPELTEAAIVVSGGRGTAGNFAPIEELADAL